MLVGMPVMGATYKHATTSPWIRIGGAVNSSGGVNSRTANPNVTVLIDDDILVGIQVGAGVASESVTDNLGNIYRRYFIQTSGHTDEMWRSKVTVTGSLTGVTYAIASGTTSNMGILAEVWRGGDHNNTVVSTSVGSWLNNPGTGTDAIKAPGHAAPGVDGVLVWAPCMTYYHSTNGLVPGTGFTLGTSNYTVQYPAISEYMIQTTSAVVTASFTDSISGSNNGYGPMCLMLSPTFWTPVYGPVSYGSSVTETLDTYDPNWIFSYKSVNNAGDYMQVVSGANYIDAHVSSGGSLVYTWQGSGASTTDQQIQADVYVSGSSHSVYLWLRFQESGSSTGYLIGFSGANGSITLQYGIGSGTIYTFTATMPIASFTTCTANIIGSTISLTVGTSSTETFTDTKFSSGSIGIGDYIGTSPYDTTRFTNISIFKH